MFKNIDKISEKNISGFERVTERLSNDRIFNILTIQNTSELIWMCAGQFIAMVLSFVSIKLQTSMGPAEYGKYSLILTLSALLSIVLYGPAQQGFVRHYFNYLNNGIPKTYIKLYYTFLCSSSMYLLFLVLITIPFLKIIGKTYEPNFIIIASFFVVLLAAYSTLSPMINLLRKRKSNAIMQVVEKSLFVIFLFIINSLWKLTALGVCIAFIFTLVIVLVAKIIILNSIIPVDSIHDSDTINRNKINIISNVKKFSIPFGVWGIAGWLQLNSEKWVIAKYLSASDVGVYALMLSIVNYLVVIPIGIISQFITPIIYNKYMFTNHQINQIGWYDVFVYFIFAVIGLVVIGLIITIIFGNQMIMLLSNNKFIEYWYILPILCFGTGLFYIGESLTILGMVLNTPDKYMYTKIISGFLALFANIIFIIYFGVIGVAISICFMGVIYITFILYVNNKMCYSKTFNNAVEM